MSLTVEPHRSDAADAKTIMVIGMGKLGGPVVDFLATQSPSLRIVCLARRFEHLALRVNLSRYLAAQWNAFPNLVAQQCDVLAVDALSSAIAEHQPHLIFNATTPFPWWRLRELPPVQAALADSAGPGLWSALDCLLPLRVCEAIERTTVRPVYVNACYPDLTNAFLADFESAPILGIGNLSNLVPGLRLGFGKELGVPPESVHVRLVAHHYVSWNGPRPNGPGKAAFHLTITTPTDTFVYEPPDTECFEVLRRHASRTRDLDGLGVTIGSASTVLMALLDGSGGRFHCPGALGLPGGYPVVIAPTGTVELDLDPSLSIERAIEINEATQRLDGVEAVMPGRVVPTEQARQAFHDLVGEPLPDVTLDNVHALSQLCVDRLNELYDLSLVRL